MLIIQAREPLIGPGPPFVHKVTGSSAYYIRNQDKLALPDARPAVVVDVIILPR